jgi:hypothetical protein
MSRACKTAAANATRPSIGISTRSSAGRPASILKSRRPAEIDSPRVSSRLQTDFGRACHRLGDLQVRSALRTHRPCGASKTIASCSSHRIKVCQAASAPRMKHLWRRQFQLRDLQASFTSSEGSKVLGVSVPRNLGQYRRFAEQQRISDHGASESFANEAALRQRAETRLIS